MLCNFNKSNSSRGEILTIVILCVTISYIFYCTEAILICRFDEHPCIISLLFSTRVYSVWKLVKYLGGANIFLTINRLLYSNIEL